MFGCWLPIFVFLLRERCFAWHFSSNTVNRIWQIALWTPFISSDFNANDSHQSDRTDGVRAALVHFRASVRLLGKAPLSAGADVCEIRDWISIKTFSSIKYGKYMLALFVFAFARNEHTSHKSPKREHVCADHLIRLSIFIIHLNDGRKKVNACYRIVWFRSTRKPCTPRERWALQNGSPHELNRLNRSFSEMAHSKNIEKGNRIMFTHC